MCSYNQNKSQPVVVESIKHLSQKEQSEIIADRFSKVGQEFEPLNEDDIRIPEFDKSSIPQFNPIDVQKKLENVKLNKSVPKGDVPPQLLKRFAKELAPPLCHIINTSIVQGKWSKIYKREVVTPIPKVFPPQTPQQLRNISGLLTFDKIAESLISELLIADISKKLDPCQYANQKGLSVQHYLVKMLNRILIDTDQNSVKEANAVIATMYD